MSQTVVIIGSGFFGVWTANHLTRQYPQYKVKLITPSDYTYFLVSSIRVPVENKPEGTIIPLSTVLDRGVEVVKGVVSFFDDEHVRVGDDEVSFDALVIATGAKWRDPIGCSLEFQDDYVSYFAEQHRLMEEARNIVLIGGGYTNVELAGELHDRYAEAMKRGEKKITMVHSKELLLPEDGMYCEGLRQRCTGFFQEETQIELVLGTKAVAEEGKVVCSNGTTLEADLVLTSIGVEPSVPESPFTELTDSQGFIRIADTFQCKGAPTNIFSIGDVTDFEYKGLFRRGYWLNCMLANIHSVLSNPDIPQSQLRQVVRHTGHITAYVSLGAHAGCGQLCLPFFGTVMAPEWFVRKRKSGDLHVKHAVRLFKW